MMLVEEALVPEAVLPVSAFKAHLRLGTGFAEEDVQAPVLKSFLRAALAAIEARIGKALITRAFSWTVHHWRDAAFETLPLAPVAAVTEVALVDRLGTSVTLAPSAYLLEEDSQRPRVASTAARFPNIAQGGKAVISFDAGFGATWEDIPADLAQAVLLLAAHYYEYRDETSLARGCMPFGVQSLLERYRPMRLFAGGAA